MALGPRLDLRQSQSLVMTPQLQQAIKLLALSNLEIEGFIAEELEKNPLLETGNEENQAAAPTEGDGFEDAPEPVTADGLLQNGGSENEAQLDIEPSALSDDTGSDAGMDGALGMSGIDARIGGDGEADLDLLAADEVSLHDHLLSQAGEKRSSTRIFSSPAS